MRTFLVAVALLGFLPTAVAGEPLGIPFGNTHVATEIHDVGGEADLDDHVARLVAGELLTVRVAAKRDSELHPALTLIDPASHEIVPVTRSRAGGRDVELRRFLVPATGAWTVRIAGADRTEGAYLATFRIGRALPLRVGDARLGGDAPLLSTHDIDALEGSTLTVRIAELGGGGPVTLREVLDPAGRPIVLPADAGAGRHGRTAIPLHGGDGRYRVIVGIDDGTARYRARLSATPRDRLRGRVEVLDHEPALHRSIVPLDGSAGQMVRIGGGYFPETKPSPTVWIGEALAPVVGVESGGYRIDVVVPPGPDDAVRDITIQNPDGQTDTRRAAFHYVPLASLDVARLSPSIATLQRGEQQTFTVTLTRPAPPIGIAVQLATDAGTVPNAVYVQGGTDSATFLFVAGEEFIAGHVKAALASSVTAEIQVAPPVELLSIDPASVTVLEGSTQDFTVTLSSRAPPAGLDMAIAASAGLGAVPANLHFAPLARTAVFQLRAASIRAEGTITVTSGNALTSAVTVVPPDRIDISGWSLVQTNSNRTFRVPNGTSIAAGEYLVVGRNATRSQFESFWSRTLPTSTTYFSGGNNWPVINGGETFSLTDAAGALVDGPSIGVAASSAHARAPGTPCWLTSSWTTTPASTVSNATPGSGQAPATDPAGIYISEVADAVGSGNYVYEFVEICFDRLP